MATVHSDAEVITPKLISLWVEVAAALVTAAIVANVVYKSTIGRRKLPPGPWPWPIIGNFLSLTALPHRSLQKLSHKYGGLMYLLLGSSPCIVVSSAEVARELFKTNDQAISDRPEGLSTSILFDRKSIGFSPYGPYWRHLRKICTTEFFTQKRIASFKDARAEEISVSLKEMLEDTEGGEAVNLHSLLYNLALNNMTRMILNKRYFQKNESSQQEAQQFEYMTSTLLKHLGMFIISDYVPYLSFITKLQGYEKSFGETRELILDTMRKMTRLEDRTSLHKVQVSDSKPQDFVDLLCSTPSEDGVGRLSENTILYVILDLLTGGSETNATTLEWAMTELIRNPSMMKRAQSELGSVVGADQLVSESHLENLPYLQAIVKETFRLHPATPLSVPRVSNQPFRLAGYTFPPKTRLLINQWAIHRDPCTYENPEVFDPERFIRHPEITLTGATNYQLQPFGAGRRMCLGLSLAMVVIPLLLGHLLHSFNWSLPQFLDPKDLDMEETFGGTAKKKVPLMVIPKPRKPASLY